MNRKKKYDAKFIRKSLRFTQKEYKHIQKQMIKTNECFTHYVKRIVIKKVTRVPSYLKAKLDLAYAVNRIGNNINQLAKIAHQTGSTPSLELLVRIENQLQELK
jgi:hypothetical protein